AQSEGAHAALLEAGNETGRVDTHQHIAPGYLLALTDQHFLHHAAIHRLHYLQLLRGNHLAFAAGDLINLGQRRPDQQYQADRDNHVQQTAGAEYLLLLDGLFSILLPVPRLATKGGKQWREQPVDTALAHRTEPAQPLDLLEAVLLGELALVLLLARGHGAALAMLPCSSACSTLCFGPSAMICPASMTISRSTSSSRLTRWVTSSRVRPWLNCISALRTWFSSALSMALVGSSNSSMLLSAITARATASAWRWPPDSRLPRSPTGIDRPSAWLPTSALSP